MILIFSKVSFMDTFKIALGNRIKLMRKAAGYSQEDLADRLKVTRCSISRWERTGKGLSLDNIEKLAECFKVDPLRLLYLEITQCLKVDASQQLDSALDSSRDVESLIHITAQLNDKGFQYLIQQAKYLSRVPELCRQ